MRYLIAMDIANDSGGSSRQYLRSIRGANITWTCLERAHAYKDKRSAHETYDMLVRTNTDKDVTYHLLKS